jgi:hypothetical protein
VRGDQFRFSISVPWCYNGTSASLRGQTSTLGVVLGPTPLSLALETVMGITFRDRGTTSTSGRLTDGSVVVTSTARFDVCLDLVNLFLNAMPELTPAKWGKLSRAQRQVRVDQLLHRIKLPKELRWLRAPIFETLVVAFNAGGPQILESNFLAPVNVCIPSWEPVIGTRLRPDGTATWFQDPTSHSSPLWIIREGA